MTDASASAKKPAGLDFGSKLKLGLFGKKEEPKPEPKKDEPIRVPEDVGMMKRIGSILSI